MSDSHSLTNERRLSCNGRNAYFSLTEDTNTQKNIHDSMYNKHYLTAKSNERARSCSPALLLSEKTNKSKLEADKINLSPTQASYNKETMIPTNPTASS